MENITKSIIIILIFSIYSINLFAIVIPQNLDQSDRSQVTKILGHGTSTKFLSQPYPLGGYSGFELGISYTQIPTSEISKLGNTTKSQSNFSFQNIYFNKGLYENFDISIQFAPPLGNTNMSSYGGLLKWGFYQGSYIPLSLSITLHASTTTLEDAFSSTTIGGALLGGLTLSKASIYFGMGPIKTTSKFLGQAVTGFLTDSGNNESELERVTHSYIGINYSLEKWFMAIQADRYLETSISIKLGLRY